MLQIIEYELSESKEKILRLVRPAITWHNTYADENEVPIGTSKDGGLPDLGPDVPWPRAVDCTDWDDDRTESEALCQFRLQLNLADFQHLLAGRRLPSHG